MKVWTKESIQELLMKSDKAVIAALHSIYALQTADEKAGGHTSQVNSVGFSQYDAPFLTDMVRAYRQWGGLTPKQMAVTRNKIKRYHRQLVNIANENEAKRVPAPVIEPQADQRVELDEQASIDRDEAAMHAAEHNRDMQQEYERMARKYAYEMGAFA